MEVTFIQLYVFTDTCPSEIDSSGHEVTVIVRRLGHALFLLCYRCYRLLDARDEVTGCSVFCNSLPTVTAS